jgi:hypothetical protein
MLVLAMGAMMIGLQLRHEGIDILGLSAAAQPGLFKLVLGLEAFAMVFASALAMITVRDMPARRQSEQRQAQGAATAAA